MKKQDPIASLNTLSRDALPLLPDGTPYLDHTSTPPSGDVNSHRANLPVLVDDFSDVESEEPAAKGRTVSMMELLEEMKEELWYRGQIGDGGVRSIPARTAEYADPKTPLSPHICRALKSACGISALYGHQAKAIDDLEDGKHVIVATATS
ncbi:hypothetical protein HK102_012157, partial [Quaeritorhiza haematococci]